MSKVAPARHRITPPLTRQTEQRRSLRLTHYSDRLLALALREIGRTERTSFILDWLELPGLRRQARVELNKGEARNALVRSRRWRLSVQF